MVTNPFRYGEIAEGEYFADRDVEIRELTQDIVNGQNVIVAAPRRYGKTSLILRVLGEIRQRGLLCVYIDLFGIPSKRRLAEVFSAAIARGTENRLEEIGRVVKEFLPGITPKIILKGEGTPEFEVEIGPREQQLDRLFDDLFNAPQRIAMKKNRRIVVVFDEFQEIVNLDGELLQKQLRAKIQHHHDVSYCFLGSKRHLIDRLFLEQESPLYRSGKTMILKKIPRDLMLNFIEERFGSTGLSISGDLAGSIIDHAANHPYFVQMFSYELWNRCILKGRIDLSDIEETIRHILSNQSYTYTTIWESLSLKQRNLVIALARIPNESPQTQAMIQRFELGSPATVHKNLRILERKEILERENGKPVFIDSFFRLWVCEKM